MKYHGRIMAERQAGIKKDTLDTKVAQSKVMSDKEVELQSLAELKGLYHDNSEVENEDILDRLWRFIMKKDGLDIAVDESLGAEDQRNAEKLEELEQAEMNQRLHFYKMKEQRAQILAKEKGLYRGEVQVNEKTRSNVFSEKENELQGLAKAKGLYHDDREAENENILGR